jgi:hypothetical protein
MCSGGCAKGEVKARTARMDVNVQRGLDGRRRGVEVSSSHAKSKLRADEMQGGCVYADRLDEEREATRQSKVRVLEAKRGWKKIRQESWLGDRG